MAKNYVGEYAINNATKDILKKLESIEATLDQSLTYQTEIREIIELCLAFIAKDYLDLLQDGTIDKSDKQEVTRYFDNQMRKFRDHCRYTNRKEAI